VFSNGQTKPGVPDVGFCEGVKSLDLVDALAPGNRPLRRALTEALTGFQLADGDRSRLGHGPRRYCSAAPTTASARCPVLGSAVRLVTDFPCTETVLGRRVRIFSAAP
jgi:hypothetical protein